jgi:prevent-host-death family protein
MAERDITVSRFKAECMAILDRVNQRKVSYVLTRHGRPVGKLVPADANEFGGPLLGSVTLIAESDEDYYSTGERWDAEPDLP